MYNAVKDRRTLRNGIAYLSNEFNLYAPVVLFASQEDYASNARLNLLMKDP
jgi:hypothetical protein